MGFCKGLPLAWLENGGFALFGFVFLFFFLNKQRKNPVNYSFVTRELRQLEEHVAGDGVAASRSTASGRDDANAERGARQAARRDLEQLLADLPTGNRAPPCRSAAPSCVCGEARTGWGGPQSNGRILAHQTGAQLQERKFSAKEECR